MKAILSYEIPSPTPVPLSFETAFITVIIRPNNEQRTPLSEMLIRMTIESVVVRLYFLKHLQNISVLVRRIRRDPIYTI